MFIVQAPHPALEATTLLPNPQFGDGENLTDEVQVKRAMDGTLYTYVKTKNDRRHLQRHVRRRAPQLRTAERSARLDRVVLREQRRHDACGGDA